MRARPRDSRWYDLPVRVEVSEPARSLLLAMIVGFACMPQGPSAQIRVACVGNSITDGNYPSAPKEDYPAVLQKLLGASYDVGNFGVSSKCLMKNSDQPYWDVPSFNGVFAFEAEVITIMLGTNDSKPHNWAHGNEFASDLNALVDTFLTIGTRPSVWLCLPPPVFPNPTYDIDGTVIHEEIVPLVLQVGKERGLPTIDTHTPFLDRPDYFPDGVHPNAAGVDSIAAIIHRALTSTRLRTDVRPNGPSREFRASAITVMLSGKVLAGGRIPEGERAEVFDARGRHLGGALEPRQTGLRRVGPSGCLVSAISQE
jgi:acyl-CoA thioesterase-1